MSSIGSHVTVADLQAVLASRHPMEPVEFVVHTPDECCEGHVHDITELLPNIIVLDDTGQLIIRLKELSV